MVRAAAEGGLVLAVNHHLPGSPLHAKVAELVAQGAIGEIMSAQIHNAILLSARLRGWRLVTASSGSGVILDLMCHDASVLNPLLGKPSEVMALAVQQAPWNKGGQFDAAMGVIRYTNLAGRPVLAQTHDAYSVAFSRTSLAVHGTEGTLRAMDAMGQNTPDGLLLTTAEGIRAVPVDHSAGPYQIVARRFAEAVLDGGKPTVSGADGLQALRVALAAQESVLTGTAIRLS